MGDNLGDGAAALLVVAAVAPLILWLLAAGGALLLATRARRGWRTAGWALGAVVAYTLAAQTFAIVSDKRNATDLWTTIQGWNIQMATQGMEPGLRVVAIGAYSVEAPFEGIGKMEEEGLIASIRFAPTHNFPNRVWPRQIGNDTYGQTFADIDLVVIAWFPYDDPFGPQVAAEHPTASPQILRLTALTPQPDGTLDLAPEHRVWQGHAFSVHLQRFPFLFAQTNPWAPVGREDLGRQLEAFLRGAMGAFPDGTDG